MGIGNLKKNNLIGGNGLIFIINLFKTLYIILFIIHI